MICFAGPLPPPTHGMSTINAAIVAALAQRTEVRVIDVNPGSLTRGARYHLTKIARALIAIPRIVRARIGGARVFYGSVDDGPSGLWTSLFALTARSLGMTVYLHHHSYRYLARPTAPMRLLATVAGPKAHHIVLSDGMGEVLRSLYPAIRQTLTVPNQVPDAPPQPAHPSHDGITIGLLANLTFEKGLASFVEILEAARSAGLPVHAILAGPVPDPDERAFLDRAVQRNADVLDWRGPVSGEAKDAFFADIDLFVFPTHYAAEAYPLVVLEALLRQCPVIATRRGCLDAFAGLESAEILDERDFVTNAVAVIARYAADRAQLVEHQGAAGADGRAINARNAAARANLIDTLVAAGV